jgi:hypothetical protein
MSQSPEPGNPGQPTRTPGQPTPPLGNPSQETQTPPRTSLMTASSAQICRDMGWGPGTVLVSHATKDLHQSVIRLTAIGRRLVLAELVEPPERPVLGPVEAAWTLSYRDWEQSS